MEVVKAVWSFSPEGQELEVVKIVDSHLRRPPKRSQGGRVHPEAANPMGGYVASENRQEGTSLRECRSGPSLTSDGYCNKAAKISCSRDRPKWTLFERNLKGKMKEKSHHRFSKAAGQGFGKPTKRCIAKEAPFLTDVPLGLGGKIDRRVHR